MIKQQVYAMLLMDEKDAPGFDEAKFMLVACSAFVNYIKAKEKEK